MSRFQQVSMALLPLFVALLSAALQTVGQSSGGPPAGDVASTILNS